VAAANPNLAGKVIVFVGRIQTRLSRQRRHDIDPNAQNQ
jgi:hypothetical protein